MHTRIDAKLCQLISRSTWVREIQVLKDKADVDHLVDLMIEAKDKEQAVLHLYRIYGLQPVVQGNSFCCCTLQGLNELV